MKKTKKEGNFLYRMLDISSKKKKNKTAEEWFSTFIEGLIIFIYSLLGKGNFLYRMLGISLIKKKTKTFEEFFSILTERSIIFIISFLMLGPAFLISWSLISFIPYETNNNWGLAFFTFIITPIVAAILAIIIFKLAKQIASIVAKILHK